MRPTLDMQYETLVATMDYLEKHYPIPEYPVNPLSKVKGPKFTLTRLKKGYYGFVTGYNQSLEAFICTTPRPQLDLIDTICHEWRHIHQHKTRPGLYNWYKRRVRTGYWDNPMEKDARDFAETVTQEIWALDSFPWWPDTLAWYEEETAKHEDQGQDFVIYKT